jgi:hypothetical protein
MVGFQTTESVSLVHPTAEIRGAGVGVKVAVLVCVEVMVGVDVLVGFGELVSVGVGVIVRAIAHADKTRLKDDAPLILRKSRREK